MNEIHPGYDERLIGLGIALAIGLLVGLQREWAEDKPVGIRSFALIALVGGLAGLLLEKLGGWPVAAGLVALGLILAKHHEAEHDGGITTLVAALVVYLIGAAAVAGFWIHAAVLGGTITLLLYWKEPMHEWVDRIGSEDFRIIARFILITLVILPVLPDKSFGPYDVFNPFETWLLVSLIVAINLAGYIALRVTGTRSGGWLAGAIGGLVSSTATTLSYTALSRRIGKIGPLAALVVLVASIVVYPRMMLEVSIVAPDLLSKLVAPVVAFSVVMLALAGLVSWRMDSSLASDLPERENPAQIKMALSFAALYVGILFAVAAVRDLVGDEALYVVAFLSGLTDVDALTLSVSQLYGRGEVPADTAWRAVFLASISNLLFKVGAAAVLGSTSLRRWIVPTGGVALAAGVAIVVLWP
jgi:uncharacterized membrane protein (DUF4010 family)